MYENIFSRVEEKYILSKSMYDELFKDILPYLTEDKYFKTTICNIYFDNNNDDIIISSLEKPLYKHKVRLRSYGIPKYNDDVFLEVKFKYNNVVGKRRIKMKLKDFNNYINKNKYDKRNQINREIDYLFKLYKLNKSYFVAYDRLSYISKDNSNLRITIDSNLRSRKDNLSLEYGDSGEKYFDEETFIMEIKTLGSIPIWLVNKLSSLKIYPVSFSKIGNIYMKDMEDILC